MILLACEPPREDGPDTLFRLLSKEQTGIDFQNDLSHTEEFNAYTYRNFYNGGGVAVGDINNDGLLDLFFCGNMVDNRLYLNKGGFVFEDITEIAGVASKGVWSTGASMVDINGDGWLDIYVCKSGSPDGENRHNELFINNGDGTFSEQANAYGLDDLGLSTHAAFFDFDRDGDLDCYLLNNSFRSVGGNDLRKNQRSNRDEQGGNKLYRNDNGTFVDVSEEAGIYGSSIGFGLGVTIGDINKDGWPDIYVSNDFFERDYLYINNHDGTFTECLPEQMPEISLSAMGADMADLNNDGYPEVFVTDMMPESDARIKSKTAFEDWDKYQRNVQTGYHHQFTRNTLQLNNQNGTFSEIGRLAGVFATDWSWGALIFDMDNSGHKDLFVANGIYKDLTDQDYINFMADPATVRSIIEKEEKVIETLLDKIPSVRIPNYAFKNDGSLVFSNQAEALGLGQPSHANGSAYADLDNDGDLDLVINNVNMPPFIYENTTSEKFPDHHYLQFALEGEATNTFAIGAQLTAHVGDELFYVENIPFRGFQSTVDHRPIIGLGAREVVDSLHIRWPNGQEQVLRSPQTKQLLRIRQAAAAPYAHQNKVEQGKPKLFTEVSGNGLDFVHQENDFKDFDRDRLLFHMYSTEGPAMAVGDVDGNGLEDVYIGGAKDQAGKLYLQQFPGQFVPGNPSAFQADAIAEDTDATFFDANGNGALDLYVCSGGNEFPSTSSALIDRLYVNDGKGNFTRSDQVLPTFRYESSGCVAAADIDGDGDIDLIVGVRLRPFLYGTPVNAYILLNDGNGNFSDATQAVAPALTQSGMFSSAQWLDYDGDGDPDLLLAGHWMPLRLFRNDGGRLVEVSQDAGLAQTNGWWNAVLVADFNNDGHMDFVAGNHGLNSRFRASTEKPATLHVNDFDRNSTAEQFISVYNGDEAYPLVLRHDLVKQIPSLKKKYLRFADYEEQTINDIFTAEELAGSVVSHAYDMRSTAYINNGDGTFTQKPLPIEAQFAPMFGLAVTDVNGDGHPDLLMGGNLSRAKPETGIYQAGYGLYLQGDGQGNFKAIPNKEHAWLEKGEVRKLALLPNKTGQLMIVAKNNDSLKTYQIKPFLSLKDKAL